MTFLRNLVRDLVDKKLWPIAVALVLALVAIPVVLGSGSSEQPAATPVVTPGATAAAAPNGGAQVAVAELDTTARARAGAVRNPFNGPKAGTDEAKGDEVEVAGDKPKPDDGKGASGGSTEKAEETPKADADAGSGKDETVVRKPPAKADEESEPKVDEKWVAVLRFGVAGETRRQRAIGRLAPLPGEANPIIVFLGVLDDHKTALFLVSSDADASGDGTCKPSKSECESVRMTKGETEFFDVTMDDGSVVQYQLDLEKVRPRRVTSKAVAAKAARKRAAKARAKAAVAAVQLMGVDGANVPGFALP